MSVQTVSIFTQSCPTLCDPMNCSTPGIPVHYQLLEFTQTHILRVSDAIQPSHPLSSPSPPIPIFPWSLPKLMSIESVMPSSHLILCRPLLLLPPIPPSIRVFSNESTLHMRWPKYWSFSFSIIPSKVRQNGLVGSPCSPRDFQESSPAPQFKSINSSALSFLHSPTLTTIHDCWKNHSLD